MAREIGEDPARFFEGEDWSGLDFRPCDLTGVSFARAIMDDVILYDDQYKLVSASEPRSLRTPKIYKRPSIPARVFGQLVRERRKARGWSQEVLAGDALGNSTRNRYVSRIENGKISNITSSTVRNIARALAIDIEEIPQSLRWPEARDEARSTNTVARKPHALVEKLITSEGGKAREFGINEGMLIALARKYADGNPNNFASALAGLERALEVARDEHQRGLLPSNISDAVDLVIARIDALNAEGHFDEAQAALDAELQAMDEEDKRRDAARGRLHEKGIAQAILTRNVENACRNVVALVDLETKADPTIRFDALRSAQHEWYVRGRDEGLNFDLEVAISLARVLLVRASDENQHGAAHSDLGTALSILGERESGTERLEEAVAAYRSVLEVRTRGRVPLQWASTQMNLGTALTRLGERESGTERLEKAVAAFRSALEVQTRERVPLDWATTQMNIGNALARLGERESGTERLEEAVEACRNALEEWTRERVPYDWAAAQINLGNALVKIGERESGTERLEEAVAAYRSVLEVRTRGRVPLEWAMTQMNLGGALFSLGERESGTERLEEAVAAYRNALREWTRERVPLDWAATQMGLGNALKSLGERENSTERLGEAVEAYRDALEERSRGRVPFDWAVTQMGLGNALQSLGYRESGTERLEEAVAAYRGSLEELTQERFPHLWAMTQMNLGNALSNLGERESGVASLLEGIKAYRRALEERTRGRFPLGWAMINLNLGITLRIVGERLNIDEYLAGATEAATGALEVFSPETTPYFYEKATRLLDALKEPPTDS